MKHICVSQIPNAHTALFSKLWLTASRKDFLPSATASATAKKAEDYLSTATASATAKNITYGRPLVEIAK